MNKARLSRMSVSKLLPLAVFLIMALSGITEIFAQPTNYCVPYPKDNQTYQYCYSYLSNITRVRVINNTNSAVAIDRSSGDDGCYILTGVEGQVKLGNSYRVVVNASSNYYYYHTTRVFIDWNQNGSFNDPGDYVGNYRYYGYGSWTVTFNFTIACSTPSGKTRMRVMQCYYYDNGADACSNGYTYAYDPWYYNYGYGECEDYVLEFMPDIESSVPAQNQILFANEPYDGTTRLKNGQMVTFSKPSVTMGSTQAAGAILNARIIGPMPSTQTVYEMLDPGTGSVNVNMGGFKSYTAQRARGRYAYGNDGSFMSDRGGEYKYGIQVSGSGCPGEAYSSFTVSWNNDLSVRDIIEPKNNSAPRYFKYLRGQTISIRGVFQNVGLNQIGEFYAWAIITSTDGRDTIYKERVHYNARNNPNHVFLNPTDKVTIDFPNARFNNIGLYKCVFKCELLDAIDQEAFNDIYPRSGDPSYIFEIAWEIQLQANRIMKPNANEILIKNRPVITMGEFKNVGVGDASDVPGKLVVYKLPNLTQPYWQSNRLIQDIPAGKYNIKQEEFDVMILNDTGTYKACLIITHPDDGVREDDTTCIYFYVKPGLEGNYTVGQAYAGNSRNFITIDSAMNSLYLNGITGDVNFLLTDNSYWVKGTRPTDPAWDFTAFILNMGYSVETGKTFKVTWKPSLQKSLTRGSVTINLEAPNGKGIQFGQSMDPANSYAIYRQVWSRGSLAKKYANSPGYVIFDGGAQRALKFKVYSNSRAHASAFFLGRGSHNITIKNVIIENATPGYMCNTWMPLTQFSPVSGFSFQPDTLLSGGVVSSYSAGIVNRATLFGTEQAQIMRIDTIKNTNNVFSGNEIYGFGFGILSLGMGQLWLENIDPADYNRFYNENNEYSSNLIYNCASSGIFLGYEENSLVKGNRIFSIGLENCSSMPVAGIAAGGEATSTHKGYNNIGLDITANEISGVNSPYQSHGIRIRQDRNDLQHPTKTMAYYPDVDENIKVTNNAVYNINTSSAYSDRFGIHIYTRRNNSWWNPFNADYYSRNDQIANNTVIMGSNGGVGTYGFVAALGLNRTKGSYVYNNALAVTDLGYSNEVYTNILYEGPMPESGGINADRNVFWSSPTNQMSPFAPSADIYSFAETDQYDRQLNTPARNDFFNLTQWRMWTGQDLNSAYGNFTTDDTLLGTDPNTRLRIKRNPSRACILNNRGENISWITRDIDGNVRGSVGQRYDIGHCEFDAPMYITDLEALNVVKPGAYRTLQGRFADAEYIMTYAPIDITANIRNNGNIQQSGVNVTLEIFKEMQNGNWSLAPVLSKTMQVDIASTQTYNIDFLTGQLPDGFVPETYGVLNLDTLMPPYVIPDHFMTMSANVTPKYKIVVSVGGDQNPWNDTAIKVVRFYLQKSPMRAIFSVENSTVFVDNNSTPDEVAGFLNYDTLMFAMKRLGWYIDIPNGRYDFDIFERTGWEPKAVNYRDYKSVIWSDGDDKPLTRYQRVDLRRFLNEGDDLEKKNLVVGSQEMVRELSGTKDNDPEFLRDILRANNVPPGNPLGAGGNNDGNSVVGVALERGLSDRIVQTRHPNDIQPPYCGLLNINNEGEGLAQAAYYYTSHTASASDSLMGVATTTLTKNVVMLAVDWRHWSNVMLKVRGFMDFCEKNGSQIIPVELLGFNAIPVGNRVDISWATASEYKMDKFEVEKSVKTQAGNTNFMKIAEEKAAGTSTVPRNYGPVVDSKIELGNTYIYRLKMIGQDGSWKYSNEVEVNFGTDKITWIGNPQPNPAENGQAVKIPFSIIDGTDYNLSVFDINGKKMNVEIGIGNNMITISTSNLPNGTYNVILNAGDTRQSKQMKVIK